MNIKTEKVIPVDEWDKLVRETYGRPYALQQQDGCQGRAIFRFTVPAEGEDFDRESVSEIVNHEEMGVSFAAWLKRDPKHPLAEGDDCRNEQWAIDLWWDRNFYPAFQMVANDLHSKGLIETGTYTIDIDW